MVILKIHFTMMLMVMRPTVVCTATGITFSLKIMKIRNN